MGLVPCRFCKSENIKAGQSGVKHVTNEAPRPVYKITCVSCGCSTREFDSFDEAVAFWNKPLKN